MREATGGVADMRIIRGSAVDFWAHDGELVFGFVLSGSAELDHGERGMIGAADAFVIPPSQPWSIAGGSDDFRLLHVTTARLPTFA